MGERYNHLSSYQRMLLERLLSQGVRKTVIARHLGVHRSTIHREIRRNQHTVTHIYRDPKQVYQSVRAQRKYLNRRRRPKKLDLNPSLRKFVLRHLKRGWSPWQIEWHIKHSRPDLPNITHETIYRYLYSHWKRRCRYFKHLRRQHQCRIRKGCRRTRKMDEHHVSNRPELANKRQEFGHWECDLMMFGKGNQGNLITLVERQTRYLIALINANRKARPTALAIIHALKAIKPFVNSITFDQGCEFSDYELLSDCLSSEVYFCTPGSPHEKGSIENRNGVIRTVLPRTHDIMSTQQEEVDELIQRINERPMRCLNYQSPEALFKQAIAVVG